MLKSIAPFGLASALLLVSAVPVRATHHLWDFNEIFSNADGTVQFIELWNPTADPNEHLVSGFTVTTTSGSSFTIPSNLPPGVSEFKFLLLATAGYAALPNAATPDFIIPDNFLDVNGDTINYAGVTDVFTYGPGALPTDGSRSLNRDLSTGINNPTNFAGQVGTINLFVDMVPSVSKIGIVLLALIIVGVGIVARQRMRSATTPAHA